jgi:hypothetical protein
MAKKLNTNEDLINDLMTRSPFGGLGQVFVVEAIRKYANALAETPLPPTPPHSFFSNETWNQVALDVKTRCDAFYNRHDVGAA